MVLAVVNLHGLRVDVGLERVERVGKGSEGVGHWSGWVSGKRTGVRSLRLGERWQR
jgi:hypothetical protein